MIGNIIKIRTPYYDNLTRSTKFKTRPGLVIGDYGKVDNDFIVLPISTISFAKMIHPKYDLQIDPRLYPKALLKKMCYIRCHKQVTINRADISGIISNLKVDYPSLYVTVLSLVEDFDKNKIKNAI